MKTIKRITTLLLALTLIATLALSLVSCQTRLKGTYATSSSSSNSLKTTYVFEGKTVKKSQSFTYGENTSSFGTDLTGEYDISYKGWNDGYEITFIWDAVGKYADKSEEERTETHSFRKTSTYIKIGDEYFEKQATESDHDHDHDH